MEGMGLVLFIKDLTPKNYISRLGYDVAKCIVGIGHRLEILNIFFFPMAIL